MQRKLIESVPEEKKDQFTGYKADGSGVDEQSGRCLLQTYFLCSLKPDPAVVEHFID